VPRSLAATELGKQLIQKALDAKGWTAEDLSLHFDDDFEVSVSRSTAYNFLGGLKVRPESFKAMCGVLDLDWAVIAGLKPGERVGNQEGLSNHNFGGVELVERSQLSSIEILEEQRIRQHCREKILQNYSKVRLLSGQEIGVDQLYVDVWLLNRQPRTFQVSKSKMLESFDLRKDRLGLGDRIKRNLGFEIANQESKLLILGKPGAGKTTFLKHLATDWCTGKFRADLFAIFIEFRQIRDEKWQLLDVIGEELEIQDENQVAALLKGGKLLVLMDGFDEVITQELRRKVQRQIEDVAKQYSKNCYIMTCRTQIMQSIPDGFTLVEVADFNAIQVQLFVCNWFRANGCNPVEANAQWGNFKLTINRNLALKELTATPVLLGLMCLVLQDEGKIPAQVSLLYERGIRLLLQKWNDYKEIDGWRIGTKTYQNLDVLQKEKLLIDIAARKFENPNNFVLFEQVDLVEQISNHLELSDRNDARAVLKSIESQHGLLVERADELWSFSHLTFQEYFTTKWLLRLSSEELSRKIFDGRWQAVLQQLIKAQGQSDRLLRLIKQAIDCSVTSDERLQEFLVWVLGKAKSTTSPYKPSAIRTFYFALDCGLVDSHLNSDFTHSRAFSDTKKIDPDLMRDLEHDRDRSATYARNLDRVFNSDLARTLDRVYDLAFDLDLHCTLLFTHAGDLERAIDRYRTCIGIHNHDFADKLKSLKMRLYQANSQAWKEELRLAMLEYRDIAFDWQFTGDQSQTLEHYYNANNFLTALLKIEDAASPEVRQEIEDNLLLPIAELKRRLPDQYGGIEES
jgi:predicted NACHT family NTPase